MTTSSYVYKSIASPYGKLKLVASDKGLAAVLWENDDPRRVRLGALKHDPDNKFLTQAETQLKAYFAGRLKKFTVPLDFKGTDFQKSVWAALLTIPFGETRSYGEIARQIGRPEASRAVGAEYSYDRVPAHLVLYVNGGIGNPSRTFATALSIVNVLASTRLAGTIDQFKAEAAGDFATGATTLETRAWLAAVFSRGSASPDFLGRALRAIAATTPADVQRVARTYLGSPTIALVLPRDGNDQN